MANEFWLNDRQWSAIEPLLPRNQSGARRVDDRRVISGILHVLKSGCRWCDCPPEYGPPTTIYNRFVRWAERGVWERLFRELAARGRSTETQMIDIDAHQGSPLGLGRKRGEQKQAIGRSRGGRNTKIHAIADAKGRLLSILLSGGEAHDCPPPSASSVAPRRPGSSRRQGLRQRAAGRWLKDRGTRAVVPNKSNRKQPFSFDRKAYKQRHRIENAFCRLKDFRRIATRYDRLARNFLASVCLVAAIVWWIL